MQLKRKAKIKKTNRGQTAVELAVFGSILIFIIGLIVRAALNFNYLQNQNLKAMRLAMTSSFQHSEGLKTTPGNPDPGAGSAARNTATVIFIEDRLNVDSAKYAEIDRIPQVSFGTGMHTRNLFMPVEANEDYNIPRVDIYVNGVHFPLTTAGLRNIGTFNGVWVKVPNHSSQGFNSGCAACFDLDRDGSIDVPAAERAEFFWQWKQITAGAIDIESGDNTLADVDDDKKEETILSLNKSGGGQVMDAQEGDLDFTRSEADGPPTSFTQDVQMFTYSKNPEGGPGTYLQIDSGKLYQVDGDNRQFIRSAQRKDSVDIVQRELILNKNTGRFCKKPGETGPTRKSTVDGQANPVEVCVPDVSGCFGANSDRTCMAYNDNVILIRSRIFDGHGRMWVTDVSSDPLVNFVK